MHGIMDFIAKETNGKNYKSHKFCYESVDVPRIEYDDKTEITVKQGGETDKGLKTTKSVYEYSLKIQDDKPLFNFFIDGSRRTYKADDIAYTGRLYPVVAGQLGVGICERKSRSDFRPYKFDNPLCISIPQKANSETSIGNSKLYFSNLKDKINELPEIKKRNLYISKVLPYKDNLSKQNDKYEDRGIALMQALMIQTEQDFVFQMAQKNDLSDDSFLLKDGSLEYVSSNTENRSKIRANYGSVVGASKAFNPEALSKSERRIAGIIADLKLFYRTPAFMYDFQGLKFSVWYLRIRDKKRTQSPFDGVLKLEKILVSTKQEEEGLDSDEIDLISANIVNERNPVCYGSDDRWAKHLYPIYLTERYVKSKYLSDYHFLKMF